MTTVAAAQDIARRLLHHESRGPGDTDNAMRRLESKYGIPYSVQWSLRYRPPSDMLMGVWNRLLSAYEVECARQRRLFEAELAKTKALQHAANPNLVRAAIAVAGAPVADEETR